MKLPDMLMRIGGVFLYSNFKPLRCARPLSERGHRRRAKIFISVQVCIMSHQLCFYLHKLLHWDDLPFSREVSRGRRVETL